MVSSVTEGEDKPLKYPLMFRACELVDRQQDRPAPAPRLRHGALRLTTSTASTRAWRRMHVSARTGEGSIEFREWLVRLRAGRARRRDGGGRRIAGQLASHRGQCAFFEAEAERIARALPRDGRALRGAAGG